MVDKIIHIQKSILDHNDLYILQHNKSEQFVQLKLKELTSLVETTYD